MAKTVNGTPIQQYTVGDTVYAYDHEDENGSWRIPDAYFNIGSIVYTQMYTGEVTSYIYYPFYLKFTTPDFPGTSKNIRISLMLEQQWKSGEKVDVPLRFAICKSADNKDSYRKTHSAVLDANQIASGVWTVPALTYQYEESRECVINSTDVEPNTTYYFFLWAERVEAGVCNAARSHNVHLGNCSIVVEYYENAAHIDTGTEVKLAMCNIDTGESWLPVAPYEDNGVGWDPCV